MTSMTAGWRFQVFDAAEDTTANALVGDLSKPAFDQIQPGTVSGREVDMETGSFSKPVPDDGCLVGSIIVHHKVDLESAGTLVSKVPRNLRNSANGDAGELPMMRLVFSSVQQTGR